MNIDEYIEKAKAHVDSQEWEKAIMNLKFAEKLNPDHPSVHMYFFIAYGSIRDMASAKKHILKLKELSPEMAKALLDPMPDSLKSEFGF